MNWRFNTDRRVCDDQNLFAFRSCKPTGKPMYAGARVY